MKRPRQQEQGSPIPLFLISSPYTAMYMCISEQGYKLELFPGSQKSATFLLILDAYQNYLVTAFD